MAKGTLHLNVEFSAVTDEEGKFGRLAKLLGLADADHARGKCEHLWVACTRRCEPDLPQWLVEQVLGESGPAALVESELATWSAGRGDSKTRRLRIGGSEKHCLWMSSSKDQLKREQRSKGGKTQAMTSSRQLDGTFAPRPAEHPAISSSSEISSEIFPESNPPPAPAPAIPPTVVPSPVPTLVPASEPLDLVKLRAVGLLAEATWKRVSDARTAGAERLGIVGVLPFAKLSPAKQPKAYDELRARIREEGAQAQVVIDHVVAHLVAQARETRSLDWLSEKAFLEGPWRTARESIPGKIASVNSKDRARDPTPKPKRFVSTSTDDEPDFSYKPEGAK